MADLAADDILAGLHDLHPKAIDLSLGRVERLLDRLGHPERRLPPVVHVAGTNGKGSTLAMLDAMLTAAGRRVHRYVSPHLVRFNERILLHGRPIDEDRLRDALAACERANAGEPITFFEITTAAAFLAFAETPADILLLETGLGGRLDATNVVENPRLVLLTPVSMDHESYLGDTIEKIAGEKAGIIKPGVPVIAGPQPDAALAVFAAKAAALGAPLKAHGRDWRIAAEGGGLRLVRPDGETLLPGPALAGVWQVENAGLAAMAAFDLGVGGAAVAEGLRAASWPARLQRLHDGPLARLLPPGSGLWLDGGHNPAAGQALAASLPALAQGRPIHLVVGMLDTKDTGGYLAPLRPLAASVTGVTIPGEAHALPAEAIRDAAARLGLAAHAAPSVEAAVQGIVDRSSAPLVALVCGSLYLAGHVLGRYAA
ncbi:MAG: bifunctional folylpolyglutamate synthase/dihydrofolate synthase [Geminicoccaceae bacterium]|nr:bifunctional folylpolyglutamate synthase/dihydrofolate synthase [Geminicoccaceae bacterium]